MSMDRGVKLTLSDLIAKKAQKEAAQNRTEDVFIEGLQGCITVHNPDKKILYKAIDMMGESTEDTIYANAFLIYNAVKDFQSPELLKAYEVKDNVEIVFKLLTLAEISDVATTIMELTGFAKPEQVKKNLKN